MKAKNTISLAAGAVSVAAAMVLLLACNGSDAENKPVTGAGIPLAEAPTIAIGSLVPAARGTAAAPAGVRDLKWTDLTPSDWNPRAAFDRLNIKNLPDNDPRANELLAEVRAEWDRAPVVKKLAGQKVRLPGYVVTLEGDAKGVREFLLVPYFGACIHVPPPPSNQIVHVFAVPAMPEKLSLSPVWVSGVLEIEQVDTAMGSAGYQIRQAKVEEYVPAPTSPR